MKQIQLIFAIVTSLLFFSTVEAVIKVACVGNSITQGYNGYPSYVPLLQDSLGSGYVLTNFGASGQSLCKNVGTSYWNWPGVQSVIDYKADIITIMLGTNDAKTYDWPTYGSQHFEEDAIALIDTLRTNNVDVKMYIVLPPPIYENSWNMVDSLINLELPILQKVAKEKGVTIIDANTPLQNVRDHFVEDGIHPNILGATVLAKVFYQGLTNSDTTPIAVKSTITPGVTFETMPNPMTKDGGIRYSSIFKGNHTLVILSGTKLENTTEIPLYNNSGMVTFNELHIEESGVYVAVLYNGSKEIARVQFYY